MNCVKPSRRGSLGAGSASKQVQLGLSGAQWTSRVSLARNFQRFVTNFAPNKALKQIARGKVNFDERAVVHGVALLICNISSHRATADLENVSSDPFMHAERIWCPPEVGVLQIFRIYRVTSSIRDHLPVRPYSRALPTALWWS